MYFWDRKSTRIGLNYISHALLNGTCVSFKTVFSMIRIKYM
ncbi:hypothetical protein ALP33_200033 [Pseudomonas amygdali pv. lachrymans]|uniref:Uncharacterized protein n=1 Tax=Pseudomonas amygdali pv. lachrymans TaxID=53707 RepID=A0AB37RAX1_PSEAV|nr:hypothetical protein BV325_05618 [Pseudomonas syringae pv. actinidiae]OSR65126.1 hypothetical protein BV328_05655 [Pseudomonas syringae pv. actinidiae]RMU20026.1 hypothetical protein ALP33_200033 [Pseudomonas amygdali pv. lachrymans]